MADAKNIKVWPQELLQASQASTNKAEKAAAPHPGVVPVATPGSSVDTAAAGIAARIGTRLAELSTKLATKGPLVQTVTQAGTTQLQGQDEQNAQQIAAVPTEFI